jgi:hypothetical protein
VSRDSDYVIGPYSAAFAAMNTRGWTVERLVECIRLALAVDRGAGSVLGPAVVARLTAGDDAGRRAVSRQRRNGVEDRDDEAIPGRPATR